MVDGTVSIDAAAPGPAAVRILRTAGRSSSDGDDGTGASVTLRLRKVDDDSASAGDTAQLLEYRQFPDLSARDAFLHGAAPQGLVEDIAFDVDEIVVPDGATALVIETGMFILTVLTTASPDQVPKLSRFNAEESRDYFKPNDGFVGAALHVSPATLGPPTRLFEIVVWRSKSHFDAVASTEYFREHIRKNDDWAGQQDVTRYELA